MDASAPWTCAACGAANADYRRRCLDCGAKGRAAAPAPDVGEASAPSGPAEVEAGVGAGASFRAEDVPLPAYARRRLGSGRRWPRVLGVTAVLALSAYGATTYFGADRPSVTADEAALLDALPVGADRASAEITRLAGEPPGENTDLVGCPSIDDEIVEVLNEHGVVAVLSVAGPGERFTNLVAFDSVRAAIRYDELVADALVDGCLDRGCCVAAGIDGRVWVSTEGPDAHADLAEVLARLDLRG